MQYIKNTISNLKTKLIKAFDIDKESIAHWITTFLFATLNYDLIDTSTDIFKDD